MRCSKCGRDNREGRKFCTSCGTPLVATCLKCGAPVQPDERFCGECGTALGNAAPAAAAAQIPPITAFASGERRHLTVLFCDLVGSTEIAARLDPEEWREMIAAYHRAAAEAITRFGGYVAQYLGDGVMAYFGWPEAHDNDGERAARAGLAILEALQKLNYDATGSKLAARVGVDSGAVVVGTGAGKDADVFGETPNVAARLQATAEPGTLLITAATHRLISGLFVVEALGPHALKGITTPLEVFQVVRPTGVRGRLQAARALTPFVGREEELRLLLSRWERTREGEGQLALIIGEPGIGKSRLVAEFHDRIRDTPHIWMESAGEQLFENTPFHALTEMLSQWLQLQGGANADEMLVRLERALVSAGLKLTEAVPLVAELLQLPVGERHPALTLLPEQKRRRLLAVLADWVFGAARLQPLVMVVEDLHWLDPSTLELQQLLAEQGATVPLMLLYTARPGFRVRWPLRTHHIQITLNRLSSRNVREMIALVAARNALVSESIEAVVERTGGVPLFVEELTRAVLESGSAGMTVREIPATLQDSLMARLDRLGPAKEIMQIGAVIGSEFSYGLLHAVHPIPGEDLQGAIRSAINAELVYERGTPPDAAYRFKHALIRDAAYEALLKSRRRELHSRIAEVLMRQFSDRVTLAPELIAHHYTEAGLIPQGISYWERAGQRASQRSAHAEAISHLTKGLELLKTLPVTPEHNQQELTMQVVLGGSLIATRGFAAAEVERAYARARELCQGIENARQIFPVLFGLWGFYDVRGNLEAAREVGEQLLAAAQQQQDPALLVLGYRSLGETLFWLGKLEEAHIHLEHANVLYDPEQHRSLALAYGHDPGASSFCFAAMTLWALGFPDQALHCSRQALALAHQVSHPFSLAFTLTLTTWLHQYRNDEQAVLAWTEKLLALAAEHGFAQPLATGKRFRGWALTMQGRVEEGLDSMFQGSNAFRATGAELSRSYVLALSAEALGKIGQAKEGLLALPEALALVEKNKDRFFEAELYRIKGELILQSQDHNVSEAESCFQQAIDIARHQSARSWELRASTSLARLWQQQGKRDEARTMLAEIYNWFTEGFDTADLKDAKALLDELSV